MSLNFEKSQEEGIDKYNAKMSKIDLNRYTTFICRAKLNEIDYEIKNSVLYQNINDDFLFHPEKLIKLFNVFLKSYEHFVNFYFK